MRAPDSGCTCGAACNENLGNPIHGVLGLCWGPSRALCGFDLFKGRQAARLLNARFFFVLSFFRCCCISWSDSWLVVMEAWFCKVLIFQEPMFRHSIVYQPKVSDGSAAAAAHAEADPNTDRHRHRHHRHRHNRNKKGASTAQSSQTVKTFLSFIGRDRTQVLRSSGVTKHLGAKHATPPKWVVQRKQQAL